MDVVVIEHEGENHVEKSRKKDPMHKTPRHTPGKPHWPLYLLGSQQFPINLEKIIGPHSNLGKVIFFIVFGLAWFEEDDLLISFW
jgi:hypothetical protein